MENDIIIHEIFRRYMSDLCSPEEIHFLLQYFQQGEHEQLLKSMIRKELDEHDDNIYEENLEIRDDLKDMFEKIKQKLS